MQKSDLVEKALSTIESDVRDGFQGMLEPIAFARHLIGSGLDEKDLYATSEHLVVVPWVYRCVHVGEFLGVPATHIELELRGTTFVQTSGHKQHEFQYYRYIDYVGALHQLGVTTTSRPALTAEEYEVWVSHRD